MLLCNFFKKSTLIATIFELLLSNLPYASAGLDVMYRVMFKKGIAFHYFYAPTEKVKLK